MSFNVFTLGAPQVTPEFVAVSLFRDRSLRAFTISVHLYRHRNPTEIAVSDSIVLRPGERVWRRQPAASPSE